MAIIRLNQHYGSCKKGSIVSTGVADPELTFGGAFYRELSPALPAFSKALTDMRAGLGDVRIAFLGDSTMAGGFASGVQWAGGYEASLPSLVAKELANAGLPVTRGNVFGNGASNTTGAFDPRISQSAGAAFTYYGIQWMGGSSYTSVATAVETLNFTPKEAFDTIDVYYLQAPGGASFNIAVDGCPTVGATVNTTGSNTVIKVSRSVSLGTHVVNINKLGDGSVLPISGIVTSSSKSRQVQVYNWGIGGAAIATWTGVDQPYNPWFGIPMLAPHLVVVNILINDALTGTAVATFTAGYQALINQCRGTGADVAIEINTPVDVSQATQAAQDALVFALRGLAAQNGVPIIDSYAAFGNYVKAAAAGYFAPANDLVHPGPAGTRKRASLMLPALFSA